MKHGLQSAAINNFNCLAASYFNLARVITEVDTDWILPYRGCFDYIFCSFFPPLFSCGMEGNVKCSNCWGGGRRRNRSFEVPLGHDLSLMMIVVRRSGRPLIAAEKDVISKKIFPIVWKELNKVYYWGRSAGWKVGAGQTGWNLCFEVNWLILIWIGDWKVNFA